MTEPELWAQPGAEATKMGPRVARGLTWTVIDVWGRQLLNLGVFIVLARLLSPADFGLVALAGVFVAFAQLVVDQGFGDALIQRRDLERRHVDTAFWVALATGAVLTLVTLVIAEPLAALLGQPTFAPILQVLSLTFVLAAFSSVQIALLRRELAFRSLAVRAIVATAAGGAVGIAAALAGAGAWALVAQQVTVAIVSAITLWRVSSWRPRFRFSRTTFRELIGFGSKIVGSDVLTFASRNADNLLIGVFLGPIALGIYSVGYRILTVSQTILVNVARRIAFPAFSRLQADRPRMLQAFLRVTRTASAVILPGYVWLAITAPELTVLIFGSQWAESGEVAAVLFLVGPVVAVQSFSDSILNAAGHPGVVLRFRFITAVTSLIGFVIAVPFGIMAVAASYVARAYVLMPIMIGWLHRYAGVQPLTYLAQFRGSAIATVLMVLAVLGVKLALDDASNVVLLAVEAVVGVATYAIALRLAQPGLFAELRELAGQATPRPRRPARAGGPSDGPE
jgi:O-antigen/teichoic acid export membrane protein